MLDKKEYRPLPFWSWNDKLEVPKLLEQVHWMNGNGIGGFFMHARSGLQTEYLSEQWMECIEACADEAKQLGMKAWIYDENGWPSGFVGGKLLEDEKNCDKYILATIGAYEENATVNYLLKEEELERVFSRKERSGRYLNLYIRTSVSTADILNPKVVNKFLSMTHEAYRQRIGANFSDSIEGFFMDEPQYYRWDTPYTDMIAQYWEEQYGEDILDKIGLLFVDKKGYRSFRYRYWKTMQMLMLNGFPKLVYHWCDEHGVKLTGHYVEETTLGMQLMCCGGVMPFYEYEHIPGIDWLGKDTSSAIAAKQVASASAQLGKKRVLTETFGCCGWDVLPSELRRIASYQFVNGVNMMCHHLVPYSERGNRKYDYPAHYSAINPWVAEDFKTFNDYYTELGWLLGESEQHVNVAMLHPIRSAYFEYKRDLVDDEFNIGELEKQFQSACKTLEKHGIEYHFLDETLLGKYGFVDGKQIGCGECSYEYLVLPSILTMDCTTERLLHTYLEQGGKILLLGDKPSYLEGDEYVYEYLESNVTLNDIINAQVYRVKYDDTDIYSTYRTLDNQKYLYVMNSSAKGEQIQSFVFADESIAPITVHLKPGEDSLISLGEKEKEKSELTTYQLHFEHADISVRNNYFPVDVLCYSKDGKEYSKPWPCAALFQKLLYEQYNGPLFLKYEFEVDSIPKQIYLSAEKSNDVAAWFNGIPLSQSDVAGENHESIYDISDMVALGTNTYIVQVNWYQNDKVFPYLFGKNVTETLRNCVVYDTELQPIELRGQFGVCSRDGYEPDEDSRYVRGENFYISKLPESVTEPAIEGFPFLAGEMILHQKVVFDTKDIVLQLPGEFQTAVIWINGKYAGKLLWDKEMDISHVANVGENDIEVRFLLGNRNRMGPHHFNMSKDTQISPWSFELYDEWEDDQSPLYHTYYDIKKIFEDNEGR